MGGIPPEHRLDVGPMREWLTERAYSFEQRLSGVAFSPSAIGADVHLTPQQRLLRELGWDDEKGSGQRRLHRWLNEDQVIDRRHVEDALRCADVELTDVYPELAPPRRNATHGVSYVIPEDVLVAAHTMHLEGMSLRQVAREIFDDCFSASHKALVNALSGTFNARGWEVRPRVEATALANRRRAFRPYCSHILVLGERKGQRCERRCVGNDEWCWRHDPDRMAAKLAELHAQDAGRRAA